MKLNGLKRRGACIALWMLAASGIHAATEPTGPMPEALKGIQPSGFSCQRDDTQRGTQAAAAASPQAPRATADLSCALEPSQWPVFAGKRSPLMVDTRSAVEFESAHVDGALNASVVQLKVKPYLKDRAIVLMGAGKAEQELYTACAELKAQGFAQVRVLRGGLPRWQREGRPLTGRSPQSTDLAVPALKSAELWQEQQFDANLVLVGPSHTALMSQLSSAISVKALDAASIRAVIERRRKETRNAPLAAVVVVGDSSETALRELSAALPGVPLLSYSEPVNAYLADMRQQQASWTALAKGPKQLPCGR